MIDTELMPRELLAEVILQTKTKGLVSVTASKALSDAIVDALDRRGFVIADTSDVADPPDEHLRTLKYVRKTIKECLDNTDSARDISSLTKRLSDVSKEIIAVEERQRVDAKSATKSRTRTKTNGAATHPAGASKSGQIDI